MFTFAVRLKTLLHMKRLSIFAILVLIVASIVSCRKDPAPHKVIFGDNEGMTVTSYDSTLHSDLYAAYYWGHNIDLNNDGQNDIQFLIQDIGSAGLGHDFVTTLKCLNENTALWGDIINQEVFLHIDTTEYFTTDSIHWDAGIYRTITCDQIAETDSVISSTEKLSLYANNAGDAFDQDGDFMSTNVILKDRSYTIPYGSETIDNFTFHYMEEIKNNCDIFPMNEEKYIGFKITANDKSRLGWIKLILHHDHVELLETAIQE